MRFTDLYTKPAEFFDNLDTSQFEVRVARTAEDREKALQVRARGYHMYGNLGPEEAAAKPNETTFLAVDQDDFPVGTLRVLDRRRGKIELDNFLDVDALLDEDEKPCAEATRFAIPKHPKGLIIKILLWKAYFSHCRALGIRTMLVSCRPLLARNYLFLLFEDIGPQGYYKHRHLKNKEHRTYKRDLTNLRELWCQAHHPLYNFMFVRQTRIHV